MISLTQKIPRTYVPPAPYSGWRASGAPVAPRQPAIRSPAGPLRRKEADATFLQKPPRRAACILSRSHRYSYMPFIMETCQECERLWQEHSEATKAYLAIVSKHQIASIQQDSHTLAVLNPIHRRHGE